MGARPGAARRRVHRVRPVDAGREGVLSVTVLTHYVSPCTSSSCPVEGFLRNSANPATPGIAGCAESLHAACVHGQSRPRSHQTGGVEGVRDAVHPGLQLHRQVRMDEVADEQGKPRPVPADHGGNMHRRSPLLLLRLLPGLMDDSGRDGVVGCRWQRFHLLDPGIFSLLRLYWQRSEFTTK